MADAHGGEDWLYHLPEFLGEIRERGAHEVVRTPDAELGGVLYHHRGVRVPGYTATFVWRDESFELEIDAVGPRSAWAAFDADRRWDFYLSRAPGDAPCLAWMTDAEFDADEAEAFDSKAEAVGRGRFSFGLYLQSPAAWAELESRTRETEAPCFVYRPSGRTLVPEDDLAAYASVVPPELLPGDDEPPDYLGLSEAHVSRG